MKFSSDTNCLLKEMIQCSQENCCYRYNEQSEGLQHGGEMTLGYPDPCPRFCDDQKTTCAQEIEQGSKKCTELKPGRQLHLQKL